MITFKPSDMEKFIEITVKDKEVAIINIDQIVSIVEIENAGIAFTLTVGKPIYTDMSYADIKKLLKIKKIGNNSASVRV